MSVPSHPLKPSSLAIGLTRLYEARSFNIKPFSERAKAVLNDAHLSYDKAGTADVIYQQLFSFHHSMYSKYIPVYTDGSKTAGYVGCGVVFNNTILSFTLHNSMSIFSADLTAILTPHCDGNTFLLRKLERKAFDIIFSWVPGHVGILGNEQADNSAGSMSDPMQQTVCYQDLKTSIQHFVHHIWQETWDQQILNKLHSIHPSTSHWAALPVRRHDVRLT
ncbi:putative RNA-directed DNA polymerase from transposon X-element [Trichonephila clavipes]|uniref:Putative RNA-directed DNA polymerase from transposon X-element n=1 Tax=Trichonephila clavipes TaxID=2585209 RepID=A0A8X6SM05_TRICX|nr:putative RNA-directed DNA polymerase from transposon X-element [Trichonephila clavipes]